MNKRTTVNPKRRLRKELSEAELRVLVELSERVQYGGNPVHKRNPGDFCLNPPSRPWPNKTLCDGAGIVLRDVALRLLREGMRRGLVSVQERNGWPQNVWAVTEDGFALEAQLDNPENGGYHGYPMLSDDPLRDSIIERWNRL